MKQRLKQLWAVRCSILSLNKKSMHGKQFRFLKKNSLDGLHFCRYQSLKEETFLSHSLNLIQNHPAYVGIAADLVNMKPNMHRLSINLLGTVIITSDLKGANELAKMCSTAIDLLHLKVMLSIQVVQ